MQPHIALLDRCDACGAAQDRTDHAQRPRLVDAQEHVDDAGVRFPHLGHRATQLPVPVRVAVIGQLEFVLRNQKREGVRG